MSNSNSISKLVGVKLKKLRSEAGITAFQLAKQTGIKSEQQLYRYERGANKIGIDELVAVLKVLAIDIGDFFDELVKEDAVTEEQAGIDQVGIDQVDIDKDRYYLESQTVYGSFASNLLASNCNNTR